MNREILDLLGHVGYFFIGLGILLLARKNIAGWIMRALGELIWLLIGISMGMSSMWLWSGLFLFMEAYGFYQWRQERQQRSSIG